MVHVKMRTGKGGEILQAKNILKKVLVREVNHETKKGSIKDESPECCSTG